MKKWYRMPLVKTVLVLTSFIAAAVAGISLILLLSFQESVGVGEGGQVSSENFEESNAFNNLMMDAAVDVTERVRLSQKFETNGKYDPNKVVDLMEYDEDDQVSGENTSGIAYKLSDLYTWSEKFVNSGYESAYEYGKIIVCQKSNQDYFYYYMDEMKSLFQKGKLQLIVNGSKLIPGSDAAAEFFQVLKDGYTIRDYYSTGDEFRIEDEEGNILYTDCWSFAGGFEEEAAPIDAANLLEIVNNSPELNGKLEQVFNALENTLGRFSAEVDQYRDENATWTEGNTNFTYLLVDKGAKKVYTNVSGLADFEKVEENVEAIQNRAHSKYVLVQPKLADFETNLKQASAGEWRNVIEANVYSEDGYLFIAAVNTEYPIQDVFYQNAKSYEEHAPYMRGMMILFILSAVWLSIAIIWLTTIAGRRPEDEELHLAAFDRWKTELAAAAAFFPWLFMTMLLGESWNGIGYTTSYAGELEGGYVVHSNVYYIFSMGVEDICIVSVYIVLTMIFFLWGYLSLVRRIKGKTLWKNSVTSMVLRFIGTFWRHRSVTVRAILVLGGFVLIHWMALASDDGLIGTLMFVAEAAAAYFIIRNAIAKDKIRKGIEKIAEGKVTYQIPLGGLRGEYLQMAEMVNDIGNGMQRAVEKGMKSERLKTDLITNVSHDIKTPLTSIINYVDLLKRENIDDPKIQGYLDILEAKAQRLKVLTEDVVEASKVSSGNIKLEMMDINIVEILNQTIGEFAEKMEAANLEVIPAFPDTPAVIHADGRRMWRVLENIFNNAAKYAMPGTRIYADLKTNGEQVQFSLKNISAQKLNIKAEELTERFIRGDISRSTEGSGLGLSIAKNLTEMQGGTFDLYLDGDLFKVTITFQQVKK